MRNRISLAVPTIDELNRICPCSGTYVAKRDEGRKNRFTQSTQKW